MEQGLVKAAITPEARRAAARSAEPVEEKALPPPFEAPARGVIVESRDRDRLPTARVCEECGASLPPSRAAAEHARCAECIAGEA
jgi:hypothetical protein